MRILVTWGSRRGGTAEIAKILAEALRHDGHDVTVSTADRIRDLATYDAAIVGGALYANRWHPVARRFVARHAVQLRTMPTWLFSSGPLDDSASQRTIRPTRQVQALINRIGALGHITFGGRLAPDATGLVAAAMAKQHAGDWRDPDAVRRWADDISRALPTARPGTPVERSAASAGRLIAHGFVAAAVAVATLMVLRTLPATFAHVSYGVLAPVIFAATAHLYFRAPGARGPLVTAAVFTAILAGCELALARDFLGHGVTLGLVFAVTAALGALASMIPVPG